ncbi:hypothetical protein QQF64_034346 [Cirrhinus molitorella]|uniref:Uncharacterized protein n=1 Tax=Cirrhinus molitorella TaxID=172907 RepID=A0ABR3L5B6_9TELE
MKLGQTLNSQQGPTIIALWQNLLPYDPQRVAYSARHQSLLTTGRFRCSKKKPEFTQVTPHCCTTTAWPSAPIPLASKYSRTSCGQEESLQVWPNTPIPCNLSAQGCQLKGNCSLSRHVQLPLPLFPTVSSLSSASDPPCICVFEPTSQCIQTDCSCWSPFLTTTCPEALQPKS